MPWFRSSQRLAAILIAAILVVGIGYWTFQLIAGNSKAARPHSGQTPVAVVQSTPSASGALLTPSSSPTSKQSPRPSPSAAHPPAPAPAGPSHVFVIVMENRSYGEALSGGYTAKLAARYAYASNYRGVSHPSLPNYLAMTSGSTWGITDDGYHKLPAGGLGAQLTRAGISWRAYMEGMSNGCFNSPYPYALKHNPFAYYGGACPSQVVSFSRFSHDMAGSVPRFVWITPDLCNDGHDCSTATANAWLAKTVPMILATSAWKQGGVLFLTWDEGEDSANSVLTIAIRPNGVHRVSARAYNHDNLLATIESRLGVGRLGAAASAAPMSDLMAVS
jgi:hypothetical protein